MARTLLNVIEATARKTGQGFFDGTFESSGNTTSSAVDSSLTIYPNNRWTGKHLYIDGGSPTERSLMVQTFVQSSGTLNFAPTLGAAPDSLAFMLMSYSRADIVNAIERAALILHDRGILVAPYLYYGMVTGSPVYNAGWEYWGGASTPDGWTATTVTVSEATGAEAQGSLKSLAIASGATGSVTMTGEFATYIEDFRGGTIKVYAEVETPTASDIRIGLSVDGVNTLSSYHTGGGGWEVLSTDNVNIPADGEVVLTILKDDDTAQGHIGRIWVEGSATNVHYYPFPADQMTQVSSVKMSAVAANRGNGRLIARQLGKLEDLPFTDMTYRRAGASDGFMQKGQLYITKRASGKAVPTGRVMVVEGSGPLGIPSADTGSVDVDRTEEQLLSAQAAIILLSEKSAFGDERTRQNLLGRAGELLNEVEDLAGGYHRARAKGPKLSMVR